MSHKFNMDAISPERLLKYPVHTPPIINIVVVGDKNIGKTSLIRFWLSLGSNTIITDNVFSKIFWVGTDPIQINIYKISERNINYPKLENKLYHAIVYVYDVTNEISKNSVNDWLNIMAKYKNSWTYEYILSLSKNDTITDASNLVSSTILSNVLDNITISAYKSAKDMIIEYGPLITNNNNEMDIFTCNKASSPQTSLVFSYMEDEFYIIGNGENENCCIIF
jgi:GTPase SAR1 family protein